MIFNLVNAGKRDAISSISIDLELVLSFVYQGHNKSQNPNIGVRISI